MEVRVKYDRPRGQDSRGLSIKGQDWLILGGQTKSGRGEATLEPVGQTPRDGVELSAPPGGGSALKKRFCG